MLGDRTGEFFWRKLGIVHVRGTRARIIQIISQTCFRRQLDFKERKRGEKTVG